MRSRKGIIGIFALVLCGVVAVVFWPEKPEPVYKGRKLSEWVQAISNGGIGSSDEYPRAIEAIGTNGIPFYLEWYLYKPSFLKRTQLNFAWKCFFRLGLGPPQYDHREGRAEAAGSAL